MKRLNKIIPSVWFIISYKLDAMIPQYELAVLVLALCSATFVWGHVIWAKGKISSALVMVFIVTMVFPFVGLYLLINAYDPDWQVTIMKIYQLIVVHGSYMGFDFLFPLFIAVITAYIVRNYNKSHAPEMLQNDIH